MAKYTSPTWVNGSSPAISAANLQALSDTTEKNQVMLGSVTLPVSGWQQYLNMYYMQTVTVTGATVTANSKVDLQPSAYQTAALIEGGVQALLVENNAGVLTAYAFGAAPDSTFTIQCTVTELVGANA